MNTTSIVSAALVLHNRLCVCGCVRARAFWDGRAPPAKGASPVYGLLSEREGEPRLALRTRALRFSPLCAQYITIYGILCMYVIYITYLYIYYLYSVYIYSVLYSYNMRFAERYGSYMNHEDIDNI